MSMASLISAAVSAISTVTTASQSASFVATQGKSRAAKEDEEQRRKRMIEEAARRAARDDERRRIQQETQRAFEIARKFEETFHPKPGVYRYPSSWRPQLPAIGDYPGQTFRYAHEYGGGWIEIRQEPMHEGQ